MSYRTDLAIELENINKNNISKRKNFGEIEVIFTELQENNCYQKPKGKYATVKLGNIQILPDFQNVEEAIIYSLNKLIPQKTENILVVGLGNREITSDLIGPDTATKIIATRHINGEIAKEIGLENLKNVSVITPSVLGKTGIEASEIVLSVVRQIKPDLVIAIDALCANTTENLFSVIQFCDSGISPGSGVKNARKELSFNTLGVKTIAIGVPTVVEAGVIAKELTGKNPTQKTELIVTPKDSDLLSLRMTQALSQALNVFLQPEIDRQTILSLV